MTRLVIARRSSVLCLLLVLAGCSLPLPEKPVQPALYDLGPALGVPADGRTPSGPPLALQEIQAPAALQTREVIYRLLYAGTVQQPRPYAHARWSMPPASLVAQRLRDALATRYPVVSGFSGIAHLQIGARLEDFSQVFSSPAKSAGVVRLRVTVIAPDADSRRLLGQRLFVAERPASAPDAAGGAQALREATDDVVRQAVSWIATLTAAH